MSGGGRHARSAGLATPHVKSSVKKTTSARAKTIRRRLGVHSDVLCSAKGDCAPAGASARRGRALRGVSGGDAEVAGARWCGLQRGAASVRACPPNRSESNRTKPTPQHAALPCSARECQRTSRERVTAKAVPLQDPATPSSGGARAMSVAKLRQMPRRCVREGLNVRAHTSPNKRTRARTRGRKRRNELATHAHKTASCCSVSAMSAQLCGPAGRRAGRPRHRQRRLATARCCTTSGELLRGRHMHLRASGHVCVRPAGEGGDAFCKALGVALSCKQMCHGACFQQRLDLAS